MGSANNSLSFTFQQKQHYNDYFNKKYYGVHLRMRVLSETPGLRRPKTKQKKFPNRGIY